MGLGLCAAGIPAALGFLQRGLASAVAVERLFGLPVPTIGVGVAASRELLGLVGFIHSFLPRLRSGRVVAHGVSFHD